ncbi:hypothetical protein LTR37_008826 [Vermiconidia calcicola]|uniref:Uncharacterized protein n=1 Tax=Vermiconidia calcicola TaxID=1690605 RepID=A0ACC3N9K9_9PEZI|nr:hypothetical protein LTR37_008826 [Vermiconidia calcicola]
MSHLNVLIVGASVAGPMAAYWFAKTGANVTVIERFPELRKGGQAIDIRTTGVTVMRKIPGMEESVRANRPPIDGLSFVGDDGRPFATMMPTGDPNAQSLVSEYEIYRGDLAEVLYNLTKDNERVKYVFGEQVASMEQRNDDEPVAVEFANGHPASTYDLVVACDGSTSRTRAVGLGCGVRDHIHSLNSWAAYFSIKQKFMSGSKIGQAWSAVGGRWMAIGDDPAGGSKIIMMGIKPRSSGQDATLPFREAAKQGTDALKEYIARNWRGAGWKVDEVLEGMVESEDFYASELVQVKVPKIYQGRFVLVGDAGYAAGPTGSGTSLAMAGAYVLAGEIGRHKGDLTAGLQAYEERMEPIIKDMQKIPPGVPWLLGPQTAWGIWLRNIFFMIIAWGISLGGYFSWVGGLWSSSFGGDKYGLPDYEWEA